MARFDDDKLLMNAVIQDGKLAFKSRNGTIIQAKPEETLMAVYNYINPGSINFNLIENMTEDITNPRKRMDCIKCKKDAIIVMIRIGEKLNLINKCTLCKEFWQEGEE
jgi:hypothetical protein